MSRLTVRPDARAAAEHAAGEIARALTEALEQRGVAHFALSGGNTPRPAYETLAALLDNWSAVELWYCDERCVAPDHPDSTHLLVSEALLAPIAARGAPAPREHRVRGEIPPEEAAKLYAEELRACVGASGPNILDVALLGIGEDGHIASLFPGHPQVEDESGALCLPVRDSPKPPPERVTLTIPVLRATRSPLLLVAGAAKAPALAAALRGPDPQLPASLVVGERMHIVADSAAAGQFS
ncbi:MAG TPA: 6-phosphogluconolactonase [Solirubrobacteraceae bacterium]|jgi:6-phosphogluconolactonase|nr:6-phosphogluconolactonase [Solirubrobacteraceae bacterium]